MKIIACVKQIGYIYYPAAIDLSTGEIDFEKMVFMLNPYDEVAVEEAIRIREAFSDGEVILITAGPPEAERALRYAFAMGGDRMIRINYDSPDSWSTSLVLAAAIKKIGFDLVLCGKKAIDNNSNQMGSFIAELLQVPQVSGIVRLNLFDYGSKATVERYLGKGDREEIECALPALFTVEMGLNDPRYPRLLNRLSAEKAKVEVLDPVILEVSSDKAESLTEIVKFSLPRPKTRKIFTPDSTLSAQERLQLMMSGGGGGKEASNILEGTPEQLTEHIVQFLAQNKILSE
jgi:electron transfer flavoprotein beta subunit